MQTFKIHLINSGKLFFTGQANVKRYGHTLKIALTPEQINSLIHVLQQTQKAQKDAKARQKAKFVEKQANQFLDALKNMPALEQVGYVTQHLAVPIFKRFLNHDKKETSDKINPFWF